MEQKEERLEFIKTLGIRWSRLRWLGTLQSSDKCSFGSNGYFKKKFCAVAGRRNISREMFKFGRTTRKRLLLHSKKFLHRGEEGAGKEKSCKQEGTGFCRMSFDEVWSKKNPHLYFVVANKIFGKMVK